MRERLPFKIEFVPIVVLVLLTGGVWGFVGIAEEVQEGETHQVDERILLSVRNPADRSDPLGPRWLEETMRDFTALGGIPFLVLLTLAVSTYLFLDGKGRIALLVLLAVAGSLILSSALKHGFQRPRPDLVPHGSYVYTTSFPSGHSTMAAAVYLTLGTLLARVQARRRQKAVLLAFALLLTVLVGASRVYLGVHWPTDVLAGWTAGGTWALVCWFLARWLQKRGQIEQEN